MVELGLGASRGALLGGTDTQPLFGDELHHAGQQMVDRLVANRHDAHAPALGEQARDHARVGVRLARTGRTLNVQAGLIHRPHRSQAAGEDVLPGADDRLTGGPALQARRLTPQQLLQRCIAAVTGQEAVGKPVERVDQPFGIDRPGRPDAQARRQRLLLRPDLQVHTPASFVER